MAASQSDLMRRIAQLRSTFTCRLTGADLGKGDQSELGVHEEVDDAPQAKYAVKRVCWDGKAVTTLVNEFVNIKNLQHPNLVKCFGLQLAEPAGPESQQLWLVMQRCKKETLSDLARKGLQPEQVIDYAKQILSGLVYLHSKQIIHRDLKGQNILLDNENRIKLADFGLSRKLQGIQTQTGEIPPNQGTLLYMAPETLSGLKIGRPSDIWSFGCVLDEMITGDRPQYKIDNIQ